MVLCASFVYVGRTKLCLVLVFKIVYFIWYVFLVCFALHGSVIVSCIVCVTLLHVAVCFVVSLDNFEFVSLRSVFLAHTSWQYSRPSNVVFSLRCVRQHSCNLTYVFNIMLLFICKCCVGVILISHHVKSKICICVWYQMVGKQWGLNSAHCGSRHLN